jgi:hypothetical protein
MVDRIHEILGDQLTIYLTQSAPPAHSTQVVKPSRYEEWSDSRRLQSVRMAHTVAESLVSFGKRRATIQRWFKEPNRHLGNISPGFFIFLNSEDSASSTPRLQHAADLFAARRRRAS